MDDAPLRIGARRYEPTAALLDGEVEVEGFATTVESAPVITQLFQKVLAGDLDVCELGLTFLLRTIDAAEHGVRPEQCSWVIGGTSYPVPAFGWIPQPVPEGVEVRHAEDGAADQHVGVMVPWITELLAEDRALLGDDWWPYGIEANRPALEAFLRYHHEQGLTERLLTIEDVFVPQLLHT